MADREKVLSDFSNCIKPYGWTHCQNCKYQKDHAVLICRQMAEDIFTLLKEQEAKTGHWIDSAGNDKCSICGEEYSDLYPDYGNTHFCPNCGAKMEGRK